MLSNAEPVRSAFADDEDYRELITYFVESAAERRDALLAAARGGDLEALRTLAHQLKGAGAGYGFIELSLLATGLEAACRAADREGIRVALNETVDHLQRLVTSR